MVAHVSWQWMRYTDNGTHFNPISMVFTTSRSMWDCVFTGRVLWLFVVLVSSLIQSPWPWSAAVRTSTHLWWMVEDPAA
jgi:hypothetical protein